MSDQGPVTWEKFAFGIIAALIAAGVIGLWSMSMNVSKLEERVASWTNLYEKRFDGMEKRFERVEIDHSQLKDEVRRVVPPPQGGR